MPEHYQLVVIGDRGVGKTEILKHVINRRLVEDPGLIFSMDLYPKKITLLGTRGGIIHIWDTSRKSIFLPTWSSNYNYADGIILLYDISNLRSFNNIKKWHRYVATKVNTSAVFMLVGNKSDLLERRQVPVQVAQDYADSNGFLFMEMSALSYDSMHVAYHEVCRSMYSRRHSSKFLLPNEDLIEDNKSQGKYPQNEEKEETCGKDCFWHWRWLKWW